MLSIIIDITIAVLTQVVIKIIEWRINHETQKIKQKKKQPDVQKRRK